MCLVWLMMDASTIGEMMRTILRRPLGGGSQDDGGGMNAIMHPKVSRDI